MPHPQNLMTVKPVVPWRRMRTSWTTTAELTWVGPPSSPNHVFSSLDLYMNVYIQALAKYLYWYNSSPSLYPTDLIFYPRPSHILIS